MVSFKNCTWTRTSWTCAGGRRRRSGSEESRTIVFNISPIQWISFELFAILVFPAFHITYEIMLNHPFASAWHHKNLPPIIRFARWCLLFPYNLEVAIERNEWLSKLNTAYTPCENKCGGYISIDVYDKWKWTACQNLLLLSLLIRYVQHDGTTIGNSWNGNGLFITHGMDTARSPMMVACAQYIAAVCECECEWVEANECECVCCQYKTRIIYNVQYACPTFVYVNTKLMANWAFITGIQSTVKI